MLSFPSTVGQCNGTALVTLTNKVETKDKFEVTRSDIDFSWVCGTTQQPSFGVLMSIPASVTKRNSKRSCDMCNGRFGLVRQRFGWKQFCCKACLDNYLSRNLREAYRSNRRLEFLARKE